MDSAFVVDSAFDAIFVCALLFVVMVAVFYVTRWFALRHAAPSDADGKIADAVNSTTFALLGLLIAFTFSGAYGRLDARRHLIVDESNAISTAYLRLDLLPEATQPPLRELFRAYTTSRGSLYGDLINAESTARELKSSAAMQMDIWRQVMAAGDCDGAECESARLLLIPSINEMIDIVTTRTVAINTHPPMPVFVALFALAIIGSALIGVRAGRKEQFGHFHIFLFAVVVSSILYLILDIEYPRFGLVRLDHVNETIVNLLQMMQ
ncbi:MAG: hypothetical protein R2873_01670 [Caldilineaceae bacterium]